MAAQAQQEPFVLVLDEFYYLAHTAICGALRELALYNSVLATIAKGESRMNEIASQLAVTPNTLNAYLRTLSKLHLLDRICPWDEDLRRTRKTKYIINDNHYRFWYYFVFALQGEIAVGHTQEVVRQVQAMAAQNAQLHLVTLADLFADCEKSSEK